MPIPDSRTVRRHAGERYLRVTSAVLEQTVVSRYASRPPRLTAHMSRGCDMSKSSPTRQIHCFGSSGGRGKKSVRFPCAGDG